PEHRQVHSVVEDDVVAVRARTPEAVDASRTHPTLLLDLLEQLFGVAEKLACGGAVGGAVQDGGELPLQLPRVEEEGPVDVLAQLRQLRLDHPRAGEWRRRQVIEPERPPLVTRLV